MIDLLDVHTHTIASVHAYSTIRENAAVAKAKGLKLVGIADHGPAMKGGLDSMYFCNFKVIKPEYYGIDIVMGIELNIIDYSGSTDLPQILLKNVHYAVASLHDFCIGSGTVEENTSAVIGAMRNPKVRIIGHPDNPLYPVDFDAIAKAAKEHKVFLEVNNSSYKPDSHRRGSRDNARKMLAACQKYGTMVIMGSDAHVDADVGNHKYSQEVIEAANFPEEMVINSNPARFKELIGRPGLWEPGKL